MIANFISTAPADLEIGEPYLMHPSEAGGLFLKDYFLVYYAGPTENGHQFDDKEGVSHLATDAQVGARILVAEKI